MEKEKTSTAEIWPLKYYATGLSKIKHQDINELIARGEEEFEELRRSIEELKMRLETRNEQSTFARLTLMLGGPFSTIRRGLVGPKAARRNCELLLSLLLSKADQEPAIGDFLERYATKRKQLGRVRADIWAYRDVLETVWPVVRRRIGKIFKIVIAVEWLRRQFYQ